MVIALAVLAAIGFIVWMIVRAVRNKAFKAHFISYGIAIVAAVFTYGYFLNMDIPQFVKIVGSILLGVILIIVAAVYQRRKAMGQ
jgi:hypothetical protein